MNKKCVRAINTYDNVVSYFESLCSASQHLDMIVGEIRLVCDGKYKSAVSRRNGCVYKFEYVEENLHVKYIRLISSEKKKTINRR